MFPIPHARHPKTFTPLERRSQCPQLKLPSPLLLRSLFELKDRHEGNSGNQTTDDNVPQCPHVNFIWPSIIDVAFSFVHSLLNSSF